MSKSYIVDTSTWILALRPGRHEEAREWLDQAMADDQVVIMPVVRAELLSGTRTEEEFTSLEQALEALPELPVTTGDFREAGRTIFRLRRQGITVPLLDALIATVAAVNGCELVHHDWHFEYLKGVAGCTTLPIPPLPPDAGSQRDRTGWVHEE